jgi:mitochondrial splicing suppressor protein 51
MMACATCNKGPPDVALKNCSRCKNTQYCSPACQKTNWKSHKLVCVSPEAKASKPKVLDQPISKPFTALENGTWLHNRSEMDVYRLLIDVFRMRIEDAYTIDQINTSGTIMAGETHSLKGFRAFMKRFNNHRELLPPWWSPEHQTKCESLGMTHTEDNWFDLYCSIEKSDVVEHYGDPQFPMQLRMFGEALYGNGLGGSNGATMRKVLMQMEGGDQQYVTSMFDMSGGKKH